MTRVITDTGPLVAFLDARDANHEWAAAHFRKLTEPLATCETVLTETAFLTCSRGMPVPSFYKLFHSGVVEVPFRFADESASLEKLMQAYRNVPMSLADACLVRMSELFPDSVVFTLDRDFTIYRRQGRRKISLLAPFAS